MNTGSHFAVKLGVASDGADFPAPMQERSRKTAEKFVSAAMELLSEKTYAELSVAELASKAGRSVGVFYQRFGSKDDFLSVLLFAFFGRWVDWQGRLPASERTPELVYRAYLDEVFTSLLRIRNLWHAALERSAADPAFWGTFADARERITIFMREAIEQALERPLDEAERRRLGLAGQVFNSVINNQIINGPGPLRLEDDDFFPELEKIVLDIAKVPGR